MEAKERRGWIAAVWLVALALLAYAPSLNGGFLWDDREYVEHNLSLRTLEGLGAIWTDPSATPQYYPLVHTTFWVEYQLVGASPWLYRLTNWALHLASGLLLWRLLCRLKIPGAGVAAALFVLHPVQVESVAWITERKNTLSTLLYLGAAFTLVPLLGLGARAAPETRGRWAARYGWGVALFVGALASKTVTCSLPAALLLVAVFRGRLDARALKLTAPLFAIGLAAGLFTAHLERVQVGADTEAFDVSGVERLLIAARSMWTYLRCLVCPYPLSFLYPRHVPDPETASAWLPLAGLVATFGGLVALQGRWGRGPWVVALLYGGTLLPALGFVDVYPHKFSFVADHFQYLATLGPCALAGACVAEGLRRRPRAGAVWLGAVLLALAALTAERNLAFRSREALWRDTLRKTPDAWLALNNLGNLLLRQGEPEEALALLERAVERPVDRHDAALSWRGLGAAHHALGQLDQAERAFERALDAQPDSAQAWTALGNLHRDRGATEDALEAYRRALEGNPRYVPALLQTARLALDPDPQRSLEAAERAVALTEGRHPESLVWLWRAQDALRRPSAHSTRARALRLIERAAPQFDDLLPLLRSEPLPPADLTPASSREQSSGQ